ncbi:hypothetical protein ACKKBG_A08205 [Auxenochlorella protothecoides x Auxenochlorella symbiontica]
MAAQPYPVAASLSRQGSMGQAESSGACLRSSTSFQAGDLMRGAMTRRPCRSNSSARPFAGPGTVAPSPHLRLSRWKAESSLHPHILAALAKIYEGPAAHEGLGTGMDCGHGSRRASSPSATSARLPHPPASLGLSAAHSDASTSAPSPASSALVLSTRGPRRRRQGPARRWKGRDAPASTSDYRRVALTSRCVARQRPEAARDSGEEGAGSQEERDAAYLGTVRSALTSGRKEAAATKLSDDTITLFLNSLGDTFVLSKAQELRIAGIYQRACAVERTMAAAAGTTLEGHEAVEAEAVDMQQLQLNKAEAHDLMVQFNLRLVISVAKRYRNLGVHLSDLIHEGIRGLIKAIDRFDPGKGFKFSTYSHFWIRQSIVRCIGDQGRDIRLPSAVMETIQKLTRIQSELQRPAVTDESVDYADLARAAGMPLERVMFFMSIATPPVHLGQNEELRGREDGSDYNFLQDIETQGPSIEDELTEEENRLFLLQNLNLILSTLPKRERNILRLRYGLLSMEGTPGSDRTSPGSSQGMDLNDLGLAYGLSRERVRQLEDKAMAHLRTPWRQRLFAELDAGGKLSPQAASTLAVCAARVNDPWSS